MENDNGLKKMVQNIANDMSNGIELNIDDHQHILDETGQEPGDLMQASDYLNGCLDIEYIVNGAKEYLGARILVTFGGPNIWINTRNKTIEGYWWSDNAFAGFDTGTDSIDIDGYLAEIWNCT